MKVFYYIICAACFAGCVSSSNDKTVKENGRTLHNGIVLPEQWPPSMIDDGVRREMSLPYISNKPTVISVNLGRQLFVDDFLIAETDMERVSHKAMFYENNPVLAPDKEWEYTFMRVIRCLRPIRNGNWVLPATLMLLLSVMEYGMMKANKNLKCGIWLVPDLCTNIVKAFILVMRSQKMGSIGKK